ncbi:PDDEXK-like family protein [Roseicyclus sp.]
MTQLLLPGIILPTRPAEPRDARDALAAYPDMSTADLCRYAKWLGASAEMTVDALFLRLGERVFPAPEHERHDRVWILPDGTPLRVQVKTRHTRTPAGDYLFDLKQASERGATGRGPYSATDFDILAMVALPEMVVRFTADWQTRHTIYANECPALRRHPRASLDEALMRLGFADAIPGRVDQSDWLDLAA